MGRPLSNALLLAALMIAGLLTAEHGTTRGEYGLIVAGWLAMSAAIFGFGYIVVKLLIVN